MAHTSKSNAHHRPELDLRSRGIAGPIPCDAKRFDIFLIDTGWNVCVSKAVRAHLPIMHEYQKQDTLYLLTPEQSIEILKREPRLIGRDPAIVIYDLFAPAEHKVGNYRGFRLYLGRFKHAEQALSRLQEFVRFINQHRTAASLHAEVRRELHREGLSGMVKVLREASEASIELI
ncbi:MAG: hypothetical protein P4L84_35335 [Isosphaeraceae bacterium]|nr:hypothetical protein [Isosphaeraceae bacterium]